MDTGFGGKKPYRSLTNIHLLPTLFYQKVRKNTPCDVFSNVHVLEYVLARNVSKIKVPRFRGTELRFPVQRTTCEAPRTTSGHPSRGRGGRRAPHARRPNG